MRIHVAPSIPRKHGTHTPPIAIVESKPSRPTATSTSAAAYWVTRVRRDDGGWKQSRYKYDFAFSRLNKPEVCLNPVPQKRGSRECRVLAAPAVSCAIVRKEHAHEHTGTDGTLRHSLRNGFTAYIVLSPENGSFASVVPRSVPLGNLTPAPRRQDHTTSPYASATLVRRDISVHRISPHVRDDREAPFIRRETRGNMPLICPTARAEYFCGEYRQTYE